MSRNATRYHSATAIAAQAIGDRNYRTAARYTATAGNLAARTWWWDRNRARTHHAEAILLLALELSDEAYALGRPRLDLPTAIALIDVPARWGHHIATSIEGAAGYILDAMTTQDRDTLITTASTALHDAVLPIVGDQAAKVLATLRSRTEQAVAARG